MSKETYWVERKVRKKMLVNMMGNTRKKTVRLIVGGKKGRKKRGLTCRGNQVDDG